MADMYLGNESGGFDLVGTTNIKNIDFEEAKISKEDYENLSEEEQKTGIHLVTGLEGTDDDGRSADLVSYDNTNSGLGSTNVQGAIDELNSNIIKLVTKIFIKDNISVKANGDKTITFDVNVAEHIPIGFLNVTCDNASSDGVNVSGVYIYKNVLIDNGDGTYSADIRVKNTYDGSNAAKIMVIAKVLYVPQNVFDNNYQELEII